MPSARGSLPTGSTDTHAHVMREDVPTSIPGARYAVREAPVEAYLSLLDHLALSRGVLVNPSTYGSDHRVLFDALGSAPDRLRGVAVVPPDCPDQLLAEMHEAGVRGCRVQDRFPGGADIHALPDLARRVAPFGWHVEVWTDLRDHLDWLPREVARSPVAVVLDHLGYVPADVGIGHPAVREMVAMAADGAVCVTLSGASRLAPGRSERDAAEMLLPRVEALCDKAPGQLLWGTDWPHVAPPGPLPSREELRDVIGLWLPDLDLRRRILVDNPTTLYDFPAK